MERAKRNLESDDFFRLAGRPFCCAIKRHGVPGIAEPTLQVVMRPSASPPRDALPKFLDTLIEQVTRVHPSLELEWRTDDLQISGYPAIGWRGLLAFEQWLDGEPTAVGARSSSFLVFARGLVFTIGMAGSNDPDYYDESDFDAILASVRIR